VWLFGSGLLGSGRQLQTRLRLQGTDASLGNLRVQQAATLRSRSWQLSVLNERDPGESRWNDHFVGYVQHTVRGKELVVGHLRPAFGLASRPTGAAGG